MSFTNNATFGRGFSGFRFTGRARPYNAAERRAALDRLDMLATAFDTAFILPGTNVRFGVESLVRLVPGVGDVIASALSCYLLYEARQLGAPSHVIIRMLANIALDGFVGAVPLVGDAFDVMWRSNRRNMRLLREWLAREDGNWRP